MSARLGLTLPSETDSMANGDNVLSGNYQIIDDAIGTYVGASAPTTTFEGKLWSTTTETSIFRTFWRYLGSLSNQLGFRAYDLDEVARQTKSEALLLGVSWQSVIGRKYLVEYSTFLKWGETGSSLSQVIFKIGSTTVATQGIPLNGGNAAPLGVDVVGFFEITGTVNGTVNLNMYLNATQGDGLTALANAAGSATNILVRDWGT